MGKTRILLQNKDYGSMVFLTLVFHSKNKLVCSVLIKEYRGFCAMMYMAGSELAEVISRIVSSILFQFPTGCFLWQLEVRRLWRFCAMA